MKLNMGSKSSSEEATSSGKAPGWLKMGKDAHAATAEQESKQGQFSGISEKRNALVWDFWMKVDETARVTFLSGFLSDDPDEKGKLEYVAVNLHKMRHPKFANQFDNYVCLSDTDGGCPFCEAGDTPKWHAVFPIIDHRPIKTKEGIKQHEIRLYLAKTTSLKKLHMRAQKLGGIAFECFDIMRTGPQSAREGDEIEHVASVPKEQLAEKFPNLQLEFDVDWYQKALPFYTREEIELIGFKPGPEEAAKGGGTTAFGLPAETSNDTGPSIGGAALGAEPADGDELPF